MKITINGKEVKDKRAKAIISVLVMPLVALILIFVFGFILPFVFVVIVPAALIFGAIAIAFKGED